MASMRAMLRNILHTHPAIHVIGEAADPYEAREKIKQLNPDVITLDVEMPKMDGISFLQKIMSLRPMPVIMLSTLTGKGTEVAVRALEIGAFECLPKPNLHNPQALHHFSQRLHAVILSAGEARLPRRLAAQQSPLPPAYEKLTPLPSAPDIIAIGASTGGVEAFSRLAHALPPDLPPVFLTQHMPPGGFTASYAARLRNSCACNVVEAQHGMPVERGMIAIAPGGRHMLARRRGKTFYAQLSDTAPVSGHRPSVDVLFQSVAALEATQAMGIIMTGMGKDGAQGLLEMRRAGARTLSQSKESCVVYGMPRAAEALGAPQKILPLEKIPLAILEECFT
jgi:two-component system chemotaxis response regulator CheB